MAVQPPPYSEIDTKPSLQGLDFHKYCIQTELFLNLYQRRKSYPLTDDKNLALSKLEAFADSDFDMALNLSKDAILL